MCVVTQRYSIIEAKSSRKERGEIVNFSENLAKKMAEHGETQYRVAKELEISQSTVASWLAGRNRPNKALLDKVAAHYGMTREQMLGDSAEN